MSFSCFDQQVVDVLRRSKNLIGGIGSEGEDEDDDYILVSPKSRNVSVQRLTEYHDSMDIIRQKGCLNTSEHCVEDNTNRK